MSLQGDIRKPVVLLRIGGAAQPLFSERLISFEYTDRIRKRDDCKMVFADSDRQLIETLNIEATWEVRWGYPHRLSNPRVLTLTEGGTGFDDKSGQLSLSFRVTRGKAVSTTLTEPHRTRIAKTWGTITSTAIAKAIAKRHRLKFVGDESEDKDDTPYVQSENVSDYQYLAMLAEDIDFEFFIENSTLYYRAKPYDERPRRVLYYFPGKAAASSDTVLKSFSTGFKVVPVHVKPSGASDRQLPPKTVEELMSQLNPDEQDRLVGIADELKEDLTIADAVVGETMVAATAAKLNADLALFSGSSDAQIQAARSLRDQTDELSSALAGRRVVYRDVGLAIRDVQEAILAQRQEVHNSSKAGDECKDKNNPDMPDGGDTPTGAHPGAARYEANLAKDKGFNRVETRKGSKTPSKVVIPPIVMPGGVLLTAPLDATLLTPETSADKRKRLACAKHSQKKDKAVKGTAVCVGDPELRAKITYEIRNVTRRFTGNWYAEEARHTITPAGYEVTLTCKRGTIKNSGKSKKKPTNAATNTTNTNAAGGGARVEQIRAMLLGNDRLNVPLTRAVPSK